MIRVSDFLDNDCTYADVSLSPGEDFDWRKRVAVLLTTTSALSGMHDNAHDASQKKVMRRRHREERLIGSDIIEPTQCSGRGRRLAPAGTIRPSANSDLLREISL